MDPDFVDALAVRKLAVADHQLFSADSKDNKELKQAQARRRVELVRWRDSVKD